MSKNNTGRDSLCVSYLTQRGVKSGRLNIRERLDNVVRDQRGPLIPVRGKA